MQSLAASSLGCYALPDRRCDGASSSGRCPSSFSAPRQARANVATQARKAATVQDWEALANAYQDPDDVSQEVAQSINEVCNRGLRDMLRGDSFKVERFKDQLSELGNQFGQQGHKQGATFIYVLYKVAEHELPAEHENLRGTWAASFTKFFSVLEDSGWRIKRAGEEDDDEDDVDMSDALPGSEGGYLSGFFQ